MVSKEESPLKKYENIIKIKKISGSGSVIITICLQRKFMQQTSLKQLMPPKGSIQLILKLISLLYFYGFFFLYFFYSSILLGNRSWKNIMKKKKKKIQEKKSPINKFRETQISGN